MNLHHSPFFPLPALAFCCLVFLGLLPATPLPAVEAESSTLEASSPSDWKLARDKNGIQVFTRYTEMSKVKEFKGVTEIEFQNPAVLLAVLRDYSNMNQWVHFLEKTELVNEVSPDEHYIRAVIALPWPLKSRELVAHVTFTQDPEDLSILINFTKADDYLPPRENYVRFPYYRSSWKIEWLGRNRARFTFEAAADPGGYIPLFLVNLITADVNYFTMRKLKKMVANPLYQQADFAQFRFPEEELATD